MLDQLYFTWSDKGLGGITGLRVRAATDGVSDITGERYNSFKPYLNYTLPQGTDAYAAIPELSPYNLIFADTGKERVLAQQVYAGRDGYNRPGVYFVHLIAGLTGDFLACDAIDLWRSTSLWDTDTKRMRDANSVRLDPVSPMALQQKKGTLSEHAIENVQQYLPLLVQAYLTLGDSQKIYIAAPNEQVAALIWGLTHSLPRALQASLTFSVYEFDVLKAPERIIGTSQSESELLKGYIKSAQILPAACDSEKGISIDCYSGKTSDLKNVSQEIIDYSLYATDRFVKQRKKDLDELLTTAQRLRVKNVDEFLAVFKFYASFAKDKPLTEHEVTGLLGNAELVTAVLHRENVQRAIINLAIANPTWWNAQAAPALTNLRKGFDQKAKDALAQFGMQVARDLGTALLSHQTKASTALMRVLCEVTPPKIDSRPWLELLESLWAQNSFHPATAYTWEIRAWFLEQWAFGSQVIKEEPIKPWLPTTWSELASFFAISNVPIRWRQLAIIKLLTTSKEPIPKDTITLLDKDEQYRSIFVDALKELMSSPQTQETALRSFARVVERGYPHKIWLLATLLNERVDVNILSSQEIDTFLQAAQLDSREKIAMLERYYKLLLPSKSKAPASSLVVDMLKAYLNKFSPDKLTNNPSPLTFAALEYLFNQSKRIPDGLALQIRDWLFVSDGIMREPFAPLTIEAKSLKMVSEAIAHLKVQDHKKYRENLFFVLIYSIQSNDDLRCVYESFTPTLAGSKKDLLSELSAFIGEQFTPRMSHAYLMPYIAEALSHSLVLKSPTDKEKFLEPLLKVLLKKADEATFRKIENEVNAWPKTYHEEWQQYAPPPPQKKGLLQKVGNVGGIFSGGRRVNANPPVDSRGGGIQHIPSGQLPNPKPPAAPPQNPPPLEFPPARPYAPNNAPAPQPQSTVNGKPIYPKQIVAVFTLKGPYIEYRRKELNDLFIKAQKDTKKNDTKWIIAEKDELDYHSGMGTEYALEALENDILINDALVHHGIDTTRPLDDVFKKVKNQYEALRFQYNEQEIKNVLLVFVRYHLLAEFLKNQTSMKEWLVKQRSNTDTIITRSPMPLPAVK